MTIQDEVESYLNDVASTYGFGSWAELKKNKEYLHFVSSPDDFEEEIRDRFLSEEEMSG